MRSFTEARLTDNRAVQPAYLHVTGEARTDSAGKGIESALNGDIPLKLGLRIDA